MRSMSSPAWKCFMLVLLSKILFTEQTCPKPFMAWDYDKNNVSVTTSAATAYVEVSRGAGRFGNNMFQFAAHIMYAIEKGLALYVTESVRKEFSFFPCLRSSLGIEAANISALVQVHPPGGEFYQNVSLWGDLGVARTVLQDAFYMEPIATKINGTADIAPHGDTASSLEAHLAAIMEGKETVPDPAEASVLPSSSDLKMPLADDLVIHFRSFAYAAHRRPASVTREPVPAGTEDDAVLCHGHGQYSLCAPPYVYYARIARRHVERFGVNRGRIFITCEPKQRSHSTVKRLVKQFGAKVLTQNDDVKDGWLDDIRYMLEAKHLVLSPSTYGWWAAYLSHGAQEVYFPIMRARVLFPWCDLIPLASETTSVRARYVYEDWWQGESLRLNSTSTIIISTVTTADKSSTYRAFSSSPQLPSAMARQRCHEYEPFLSGENKRKQEENMGRLEVLYKSSQPVGNATAKAITKSNVAAAAAMGFASFGAGGIRRR